jgi:hypothetical protein
MNMLKSTLLILMTSTSMMGQDQFSGAVPPLKAPGYNLGLGYDFLAMQSSSVPSIAFNGLNASGIVECSPRWGATIDFSYVRKSDVFDSGHNGYVMTFLAGPELYLKEYKGVSTFTHALVGTGLVDSAVPTSGAYLGGWVFRPSFAAGAGIEKSLRGRLGVRVYGDYVRTEFANSLAAIEPQNNVRFVISFLYKLPFKGAP